MQGSCKIPSSSVISTTTSRRCLPSTQVSMCVCVGVCYPSSTSITIITAATRREKLTVISLHHKDLYGYRNDCLESLVALIRTLAQSWSQRSPELKRRDKDRLLKPTWYMSNNMVSQLHLPLFSVVPHAERRQALGRPSVRASG